MSPTDEVGTFAGRLATFERPHHFAKRRASSAKKKVQSTVTWPHENPAPEDLARAGFYYKPSTGSPDSVTCFLCDKALDGWDPADNPAAEHLSHVPDCGWAINVCIEQRSQDMDRAEEDPHSEHMIESRRNTFRDAWPHEGRKGWKCKTQKMVEAGWCYAPLPEADDCVHCFYCGVSLDGWEPKDDPWEEHRRRAPECHFFTLIEESKRAAGKKSTKSRARATSRTSKPSRISTQSSVTIESEAPSVLDNADDPAEEGDTILTTISKSGKGTKKAAKKAPAKRTRVTKNKDTAAEESLIPGDQQIDDALMADLRSPELGCPMPQPAKLRGKRAPKKTAAASSQPEVVDESVVDIPPLPPTRKVSRAKKPRNQRTPSENIHEPLQEVEMNSSVIVKETGRATRGKKRTSDGLEKTESSIVSKSILMPLKIRNIAAKISQRVEEPSEPEKEAISHEDTHGDEVASTIGLELEHEPEPVKARSKATKKSAASRQQVSSARSHSSTGSIVVIIENPGPRHSAEADTHSQVVPTPRHFTVTKHLPPPALPPSPQSSDAENVPPSSRPSLTAAGASETIRIPLAATTPRTSPSKRNIVNGGLHTTQPWTAVDLESIFFASPRSRGGQGQENLSLENVFLRLTSPEKKMSVEEWILWNAKCAEQKLKGECERLIGMFEGEGNRALRSLEGIEAV